MKRKVNCIMLIDDNPDDNFFHKRVIFKNNSADHVLVMESGIAAIEFFKKKHTEGELYPDLVFLDINMPAMNGWEFLQEFKNLQTPPPPCVFVVMLTTAEKTESLHETSLPFAYRTKPLTDKMLNEVLDMLPQNS